jgi:hypothetical protein
MIKQTNSSISRAGGGMREPCVNRHEYRELARHYLMLADAENQNQIKPIARPTQAAQKGPLIQVQSDFGVGVGNLNILKSRKKTAAL